MSNQIAKSKNNEVSNGFEMRPANLKEAMELAKIIADSDICPKDHKGKPGNVLVAIQMGSEVGLLPLQAINSISVINGKPTVWGDAALALVMRHAGYEWHEESIVQDKDGNHRAYCIIKRKGNEPHTSEFSVEDAKKAGLWTKGGTWTSYPKRMLQLRARGFALRDKFPDALKGFAIREEVLDYETIPEAEVTKPKLHGNHSSKSDYLADMLGGDEPTDAEFVDTTETEILGNENEEKQ